MEKKTLIQLLLIFLLIFVTYLIFNFFYIKNTSTKSVNLDQTTINTSSPELKGRDIIENIKYSSNNNKGDIYEILADTGESDIENPELMFLTNVKGRVIFLNKSSIILSSDFANFNTKTFETTFINNVKVKRNEETIFGDELYLVLDKEDDYDKKEDKTDQKEVENFIKISRNVIYKKPGYNLKADILEVDLITKNIKIYMLDKNKKILAKTELE